MNRHVEVIGLEMVGHFAELLQIILALGLLESESLRRFGHLLGDALRATPVPFRDLDERRHKTECVVTIVAAVAEEHVLFGITAVAIVTNVFRQL